MIFCNHGSIHNFGIETGKGIEASGKIAKVIQMVQFVTETDSRGFCVKIMLRLHVPVKFSTR